MSLATKDEMDRHYPVAFARSIRRKAYSPPAAPHLYSEALLPSLSRGLAIVTCVRPATPVIKPADRDGR